MSKRAIVITSPSLLMTKVIAGLEKAGVTVKVLDKAAIGTKAQAAALAEEYAQEGFDIVLYSALLSEKTYPNRILEMDPEMWENWKNEVFSSSYYSYQFFKKLLTAGKGKYFVIASSAGVFPDTSKEAEGAAAAAVFMDMRCVAAELSNANVTVNAFAVGEIEGVDAADETKKAHIPAHQYGNADRMAERMVADILSEDTTLNGAIINLDGGFGSRYMREW